MQGEVAAAQAGVRCPLEPLDGGLQCLGEARPPIPARARLRGDAGLPGFGALATRTDLGPALTQALRRPSECHRSSASLSRWPPEQHRSGRRPLCPGFLEGTGTRAAFSRNGIELQVKEAGDLLFKRSMEAGFDRHMAKPPSIEALEELLAKAPAGGAAR